MKKSRFVMAALTAGALALSAHPLLAATTVSSTFTVTATVNDKCTIKTGPATYSFGVYDPTIATDLDTGSGSAVIKCTKGTSASITLTTPTAMTNGTDTLTHSFFQDAGRATAFGTVTYASTTNADHTVNFFGRIPALQDVGAGTFNGTSSFNVTY
jgi:spore coat protein U-like protein